MLERGNENFLSKIIIIIIINKKNSFSRKTFRILTKRILTCLFLRRGGGVIQHFG